MLQVLEVERLSNDGPRSEATFPSTSPRLARAIIPTTAARYVKDAGAIVNATGGGAAVTLKRT